MSYFIVSSGIGTSHQPIFAICRVFKYTHDEQKQKWIKKDKQPEGGVTAPDIIDYSRVIFVPAIRTIKILNE